MSVSGTIGIDFLSLAAVWLRQSRPEFSQSVPSARNRRNRGAGGIDFDFDSGTWKPTHTSARSPQTAKKLNRATRTQVCHTI
jgi:hypothetical protein